MSNPASAAEACRTVECGALQLAGTRKHYDSEPWKTIPAQWMEFVPHVMKLALNGEQVSYGLCFETGKGIDYMCAVPVADDVALPPVFVRVQLPALKYAVIPHIAHVSELYKTIGKAFREVLPAAGLQPDHADGHPGVIERYGPGFNPQTGFGDVEIWIPVKG